MVNPNCLGLGLKFLKLPFLKVDFGMQWTRAGGDPNERALLHAWCVVLGVLLLETDSNFEGKHFEKVLFQIWWNKLFFVYLVQTESWEYWKEKCRSIIAWRKIQISQFWKGNPETNETGVRKQNNDSWHLVFSYIKNWKAYKSLIFRYKDSIAYLILPIRPENVRKMPFMHGYSCYCLTIKLQTSAWLACNFFVNNYFLVRPLSDVRYTPVSLKT